MSRPQSIYICLSSRFMCQYLLSLHAGVKSTFKGAQLLVAKVMNSQVARSFF